MLLNKYTFTPVTEPNSSYYSPTNLFLMDLNDDLVLEIYERGVCLIRTLPLTNQNTITFLGPVSDELINKNKKSEDDVIESTIPESPFTIDRDNAEYIYSVKDTVEMYGSKYKDVRRKINRINNQIFKCQICKLESLALPEIQDKLWEIFEDQLNSTDVNAQIEAMAFEKWLLFAEQLPTELITILRDEKPVGFGVVELVGKTLLIHFFKTDHSIPGLAEFLFCAIAKQFKEKARWLNFQQDLGIEGLRKFKNHLQPTMQLPTFILLKH